MRRSGRAAPRGGRRPAARFGNRSGFPDLELVEVARDHDIARRGMPCCLVRRTPASSARLLGAAAIASADRRASSSRRSGCRARCRSMKPAPAGEVLELGADRAYGRCRRLSERPPALRRAARHSAFSFLDGASHPEEMAGRAAELGHEALALTDHDGLCGSLAFAHAARAAGVRPITGAELTLRRRRPPDPAGRDAPRGYANLCRLITLAHADTRPPPDRRAAAPGARPRPHLGAARGGPGVPHRLRPRRAGAPPRGRRAPREAEAALRGLVARLRAGQRLRRDPAPPRARRPARSRATWPRLAEAAGVPAVATGDPHAHDRRARPACRTPSWPSATALTLDGSEAARRGNREAVLRPPGEMAALLRRPPGGRRRRAPAWPSAWSSTSPATSATASPTSSARPPGRDGRGGARARLPLPARRPLPQRAPAGGGAGAPGRGAGADRPPRPGRLLPAAPRDPGARARGGATRCARPARPAAGCRPAGGGGPRWARSSAT